MKKIAQFHKVSFGQFLESWQDTFEGTSEDEVRQIFDSIELPKRATRGSAGYDFYSPVDFELKPGETIKIPTGIRVYMEESWVLNLFPRSGLGFKFRLQMNNTVGLSTVITFIQTTRDIFLSSSPMIPMKEKL